MTCFRLLQDSVSDEAVIYSYSRYALSIDVYPYRSFFITAFDIFFSRKDESSSLALVILANL